MVKISIFWVLLSVLSMSLFLAGCPNYIPATPTTNNTLTEEPITTAPPTENTTPAEEPTPTEQGPRTLEKDVYQVWGKGFYHNHPERKEAQTIVFRLEKGDKVEGEVTVGDASSKKVMAFVTGPDGEVIRKTDTIVVDEENDFHESTQEYPWEFSFTAGAAGEYMLEINTEWAYVEKPVMAHLRVTIYPE